MKTTPASWETPTAKPVRRISMKAGVITVVTVGALGAAGLATTALAAGRTAGSTQGHGPGYGTAPSGEGFGSGQAPAGGGRGGPGAAPGGSATGVMGTHLAGTVTKIDGDTFTITTTDAASRTVTLTGSTTYRSGGASTTKDAVQVGRKVTVTVATAPTDVTSPVTATEVAVALPHLAGTVSAVTGTGFTLLDADGFTRTVVTGPTTTYRTDDAASDAATVVVVGRSVTASGTVDADGTSLDATAVSSGAAAAPDRGAGGGGGAGGGRGGQLPGGTGGGSTPAPSATAAAT